MSTMSESISASTREIPKIYSPEAVEGHWYQHWHQNGYFHANVNGEKKPYTIVIPPPNVTSVLHIGHAFNNTIQDILTRFYRKRGYEALYLPGTDHAGIATQAVVEKQLATENLTRYDLGREKFVERVWEWKEVHGNKIIQQLKLMGCSCDWERERFTRDQAYSDAVKEVFVRLYNEGKIYRGHRIVNWDPVSATALSDEEVDHKEIQGKLYHLRYRIKDSDDFIVVATTRPETLLGDTGVAIAPDDEEKQHLLGKTIIIPLVNREVPVFADEHVDKDFGSGFVKATPAHDPNDFEMGQRHQLPQVLMLDRDGKVLPVCLLVDGENVESELPVPEPFAGLDRFEARKRIIAEMEALGQVEKIEDYTHSVGHSYRSHVPIEPYLSSQWFVKMKDLAQPALDAVVNGDIKLHPGDRWLKTYIHWMENIQDWCISRQLWWGHRIPVYYDDTGRAVAKYSREEAVEALGTENIRQDEDVLDTWFSSWLWPFATLGWPDNTEDLQYFYPTATLVTGPDIIFFWVARMIVAGYAFTGKPPFSDVYLNGIVRDGQGRKMSKSLGNGIDPSDIIKTHSADALRSTLVLLSSEGQDINLAEEDFEVGRNFSNKIWNAYRFLGLQLETPDDNVDKYRDHMELADRWILSKMDQAIAAATGQIEKLQMSDSMKSVYHFFWDDYCDWYLELIKPRLYQEKGSIERKTAEVVATHVLKNCMHLLHPFIPFITEEIWQRLKNPAEESLVVDAWPETAGWTDQVAEDEMQFIQLVTTGLRTARAEMNVPPASKAEVVYRSQRKSVRDQIQANRGYIEQLARLENMVEMTDNDPPENAAAVIAGEAELFMPLAGLINLDVERSRLQKEIARLEKQVVGLEKKLANESFLAKAPRDIVDSERGKLRDFSRKLEKLKGSLERLV